jgi:hypothetical protein
VRLAQFVVEYTFATADVKKRNAASTMLRRTISW